MTLVTNLVTKPRVWREWHDDYEPGNWKWISELKYRIDNETSVVVVAHGNHATWAEAMDRVCRDGYAARYDPHREEPFPGGSA